MTRMQPGGDEEFGFDRDSWIEEARSLSEKELLTKIYETVDRHMRLDAIQHERIDKQVNEATAQIARNMERIAALELSRAPAEELEMHLKDLEAQIEESLTALRKRIYVLERTR